MPSSTPLPQQTDSPKADLSPKVQRKRNFTDPMTDARSALLMDMTCCSVRGYQLT